MLKNVIKKIKSGIKKREVEKQQELKHRFYEIRGAVIKFYEDKDITDGNPVDVPAFVRADKILQEVIKTEKDINFYYKSLLKYGVAHGR